MVRSDPRISRVFGKDAGEEVAVYRNVVFDPVTRCRCDGAVESCERDLVGEGVIDAGHWVERNRNVGFVGGVGG